MLHGLLCHFGFMTKKKCDLGEVDKAMFQVVARHCELIFFLLIRPKCDLCEIDKDMFQVSE